MIDDGTTDGEVAQRAGLTVIRFERHLPPPPAVAWVALTDPDFLSRWWGAVALDLRPGGRFDVTRHDPGGSGEPGHRDEQLTTYGTVTTCVAPHVLETDGDVDGLMRWELTAESGGTALVCTTSRRLPDELRARTLAGWHFHLLALHAALTGENADLVTMPEWPAIHARYAARFG